MTDPWYLAADRIAAERAAVRQAAAERAVQERQQREREEAEATRKYEERKAAIDAAVPLLERFLAERGSAAQALMAAHGGRARVMFGADSGGGFYHSVYFDQGGLRQENGTSGSHGGRSGDPRPASVREAVEYFASYGVGDNDPAKVREVVQWFERQVDSYASRS